MPSDIELTESRDIRIDATGDIGTVSGGDNIQQQHANALFRAAKSITVAGIDRIDAERRLYSATEDELQNLPYVDEIVRLEIDRQDPRSFSVSVVTNALADPYEDTVIA